MNKFISYSRETEKENMYNTEKEKSFMRKK